MGDVSTLSLDEQLSEFVRSQTLPLPEHLTLDDKFHRFGEGEKGREPHWYKGTRTDSFISLTVGSHKDESAKISFRTKNFFQQNSRSWHKGTSLSEKWHSFQQVGTSPYLERKKISSLFGTRINPFGDLVIPMRSPEGELVGLQTIHQDGKKLFVSGSKKKTAHFELEDKDLDRSRIFVTDGFATAVSVCLATKALTVCAFDSGNSLASTGSGHLKINLDSVKSDKKPYGKFVNSLDYLAKNWKP